MSDRRDTARDEGLECRTIPTFSELALPVYWFNDPHEAHTWTRPHTHPWGELTYVGRGCMVLRVDRGSFLVRPDTAVWVPAGTRHEWFIPRDARDCALYVDMDALGAAPHLEQLQVLEITPLMRELILHLCVQPWPYRDELTGALVDVLVALLRRLPTLADPLAMPSDPRLVELCATLVSQPGSGDSLTAWGRRLGMSRRNLSRVFRAETGMSFQKWRQAVRLSHARNLLREGESVTSVCLECGWTSLSGFIALFRRTYGVTPGQMARQREQGSDGGAR